MCQAIIGTNDGIVYLHIYASLGLNELMQYFFKKPFKELSNSYINGSRFCFLVVKIISKWIASIQK